MSLIDLSSLAQADFGSGLHRAKLRYPDLDLERCKLIGWGAGSQFESIYPRLGIELDYTVCVWEKNIGQVKCGVQVHAADKLRDEDPDKVLVMIFSNMWFDCMRQIPTYGKFRVVRAYSEHGEGDGTIKNVLEKFFRGEPATEPSTIEDASIGLVMQGPVLADVTPMVLAANRRNFPFARLVLSTWSDTPEDELALCRPYVDEIVTSPRPAQPGLINAMLQRDSTQAGMLALSRRGITYAFKTRTDQSITGDYALEPLLELVQTPIDGADAGRRQRIAFCGPASWRFIPFHLTDQLQFGRVADLLEFWDTRDESLIDTQIVEAGEPAGMLTYATPEACILRCYLRRIGVDHDDTSLSSYWRVFADRFTLMPESSFGFLNWKTIPLFDVTVVPPIQPPQHDEQTLRLMNGWGLADWHELLADRAGFDARAEAIDHLGLKVSDLAIATPFRLQVEGGARRLER